MAEQITFDRSLYLPEAVEAAAAAYAEHARIEVTSTPDSVVAVITEAVEYDPQTLAHAFCNHVLYETIARNRRATSQEAA
jgi:hypothetical protein